MNIDYMDYEAVAGLRFKSLSDGCFMRAEIICNTKLQARLNRAMQDATNALTNISLVSRSACEETENIMWRLK